MGKDPRMAYRQAVIGESFAERHLDELILTEVDVAPEQGGRYLLSVRMRSNTEAMSQRFGLLLTLYLRLFVMRRATSEYSGRILVDSRQMQLVREGGFAKLSWSQLSLPRHSALVLQSYPAALAASRSRQFELARLVVMPFQPQAGQLQAEEAATAELTEHARELRMRVWVEEEPPLPPGWTTLFGALGYPIARSIGEPLAEVLRVRLFDAARSPFAGGTQNRTQG